MDDLQRRATVREFAGRLIDPEWLRDKHDNDGHDRCTSCKYQQVAVPWPCVIRRLADEAARIRATHDLTRRTAA